ncbi:trypsin-like [Aricia agestis]|uniref:trypsin-like n=1 Tax=Aricia agestis TaxID=91739 RepID=UPI001C20B68D|nr:trypsin-like [Aricia agestis]
MKAAVISLVIIVCVAILAVSVMIKFASNLSEEERQRVHGLESYRIGQNILAKIDANLNTKIANRFPYVAAIVRNGSNSWNSVCFGSVILDKWLVTSAHCKKASTGFVRHKVLLLYDFTNNSSRLYDVVFWKAHERFNGSLLYDISVAAFDMRTTLKLKTSNVVEMQVPEVDACIWKTVSSMNRRMYLLNDIERYTLSVAPPERCGEFYNITINESQICVDLSSYEDCFIFEFGPVFWGNNLVGVLAQQPKDCEGKLAIFTNVSYFSPWITQTIKAAPF